jgi:hypothetical protein
LDLSASRAKQNALAATRARFVMPRSSLIQRAIYDGAKQTLAVTFTTGRTYLYFDIPADLYWEFVTAPSQGQFFNWRIRDQFECRELE